MGRMKELYNSLVELSDVIAARKNIVNSDAVFDAFACCFNKGLGLNNIRYRFVNKTFDDESIKQDGVYVVFETENNIVKQFKIFKDGNRLHHQIY